MRALETLIQDIRYGWRTMLRTPGVSAVAVLSLALGIGANAGIYALIDRVMLRVLPVKDPRKLVVFDEVLPYPEFKDLRDKYPVFDGAAGSASLSGVSVGDTDDPSNVLNGVLVSGNYFDVLGVHPLLGHAFTDADNINPGAHPVVIISYAAWKSRFHGDPGVLGQTIRLGPGRLSSGWGFGGFEEDRPVVPASRDFTVVGVMPPQFAGETVGQRADFWAPLMMEEHFLPGRHWISRKTASWVRVMARLKPGVSRQQAEAAVTLQHQRWLIESEGPALTEARRREIQRNTVRVLDGGKGFSNLRDEFSKPLWVLMAMVGTVLLIACANLANLLLARGAARRREFATRLALGVSRKRLVRQLVTESLILSLIGAALSVPVGWAIARALFVMVSSGQSNLTMDLAPDAGVLLFTALIAILTTLICGLVPALRSTHLEIGAVLKENARGSSGARSQLATGKAVVVAQVALSVVLLFGAGLFIRTLYNMKAQDLGYVPQNILIASLDPTGGGYKGDDVGAISQRVLERIRELPGVTAASYSDNGLFGGKESGTRIRIEGYQPSSREDALVRFDQVGPGYFHTVGIPILLGRDIADSDTARATRVAVINESMAKFYFGNRNPVGRTFLYDAPLKFTLTIVGVAKDVRDHTVRNAAPRRFYVSYMQAVDGQMGADYEIRTPLDAAVMEKQLRGAVRAVAPRMPIVTIHRLIDQIDNSMIMERLVAELAIFFGILALVLGCVGLYGIMSYSIVRRTQEIGIRIALGASRYAVVWMVLRDALILVGLGLIAGIPIALGLSRYLQSLLFGLKPMDAFSLIAVLVLMAITYLTK
ncbi:MAG: ABC transporter permease [Acidobacteriota bacterium]|nr:ABC transporter permease [Acidobacteriota bacterium]